MGANASAWDRRRRSRRVRMTPASTTPVLALVGTGRPPGLVERCDRIGAACLEPRVPAGEQRFDLGATAGTKDQAALPARAHLYAQGLSRSQAQSAPHPRGNHHLSLGAEPGGLGRHAGKISRLTHPSHYSRSSTILGGKRGSFTMTLRPAFLGAG